MFDLNRLNHPQSWNVYDSLADGYRAAGNIDKARWNYKKALEIKPDFKVAKDKLEKLQ